MSSRDLLMIALGVFLGIALYSLLFKTSSMHNHEEIVWTDWRGRERKIVISRVAEWSG